MVVGLVQRGSNIISYENKLRQKKTSGIVNKKNGAARPDPWEIFVLLPKICV